LTASLAVFLDTAFYHPEAITWRSLWEEPVITPLNNLLYNTSITNLANHGLHPFYQHLVANLPQLLGPVYPLLFLQYWNRSAMLASALSGVLLLSIFPHQEARFLIPAVPLVLSSINLPARYFRPWVAVWIIFNLVFGVLMGIYHQGGVVPMQNHLAAKPDVSHILWWKTYSPPIWLLDGKNENTTTTDLMGMSGLQMVKVVTNATACVSGESAKDVYLVAPASTTYLDAFSANSDNTHEFALEERWRYNKHLSLDDLDFAEDGIWPTLSRVIGRRGLVLWNVKRRCS
jgi:GPI mannosyltransferase 4